MRRCADNRHPMNPADATDPHATLSYEQAGVDYDLIDPLKVAAQRAAAATGGAPRGARLQRSRRHRAANRPTWSTSARSTWPASSNAWAPRRWSPTRWHALTGKSYYDGIAQDTIAMAVNDLITVGATPLVVQAYWAAGGSDWFADAQRAQALVDGWKRACDACGVAWGGGETPALAGIVEAGRIDLAASCTGLVNPKAAPVASATSSAPGDAIVLLASSGIHANGLSLARKLVERLPQGYLTPTSAPGLTLRRSAARAHDAVLAGHRGAVARPASRRTTAPTSPATAGASCCAIRRRFTYRIHTVPAGAAGAALHPASMRTWTTARPTARSTWARASRCSSPADDAAAHGRGRARPGIGARVAGSVRGRPQASCVIEPLGAALRRRRASTALTRRSGARQSARLQCPATGLLAWKRGQPGQVGNQAALAVATSAEGKARHFGPLRTWMP